MSNYVKHWEQKIALESKMHNYFTLKYKFLYEDYLNLSNIEHRIAMTRTRKTLYRLALERGIHNTPLVDRKCKICNSQAI